MPLPEAELWKTFLYTHTHTHTENTGTPHCNRRTLFYSQEPKKSGTEIIVMVSGYYRLI